MFKTPFFHYSSSFYALLFQNTITKVLLFERLIPAERVLLIMALGDVSIAQIGK